MADIFANISEKNKCKLLKILEANTHTFRKNEDITGKLKNENLIGIILSGVVEIIREDYDGNRTLIEELEAGDIFSSKFSSIENVDHTMVVIDEATVILIGYNEIINCDLDKDYYIQFMKNLLAIFMEKLQEKNEHLEILSRRSIRNKLLEYFRVMSKKHGSRFVYLPFNFTDLADYLVIDRCAMSRELKYLKEEGFIEVKGKRITLLYDRR